MFEKMKFTSAPFCLNRNYILLVLVSRANLEDGSFIDMKHLVSIGIASMLS